MHTNRKRVVESRPKKSYYTKSMARERSLLNSNFSDLRLLDHYPFSSTPASLNPFPPTHQSDVSLLSKRVNFVSVKRKRFCALFLTCALSLLWSFAFANALPGKSFCIGYNWILRNVNDGITAELFTRVRTFVLSLTKVTS